MPYEALQQEILKKMIIKYAHWHSWFVQKLRLKGIAPKMGDRPVSRLGHILIANILPVYVRTIYVGKRK